MIMYPAIIALFVGSVIVTAMILYAAFYGVRILLGWNLESGSETQLDLERKTYLISTLMSCAFCFQLFSLFLFIFTADDLSHLFVGAMCAAGTLNVNAYGYPALLLKIVTFLLGGIWLIVNFIDNRAMDYPLIKKKYLFLLFIAPLVVAETGLQSAFFLNLDAHVITSCCGSLFNAEGRGAGAVFTAVPHVPMKMTFFTVMFLIGISGLAFSLRGKAPAGILFAALSAVGLVVSVTSLISFISIYIYQLPTHHCPFCILQREYNYVGYLLYLCMLGAAVTGVAVGVLMPARKMESLQSIVPPIQKRLTLASLLFQLVFVLITISEMVFTNFRLGDG